MIACEEADLLAAAHSVGSLDRGDEPLLQKHLEGCSSCRRLAGEYLAAAARLSLTLEPKQPSPELRQRLMRTVYAEAAAKRNARPAAVGWWQRLWDRIPVGRAFTVGAGLATAAVIGVTSWAVVATRQAPPAPVSLSVSGTATHPGAQGQVVYDRLARQAVLTVTGLPTAAQVGSAPDSQFEVWLIPPHGAPAPYAFLNKQPDGRWAASLQCDMSQFSAISATVEPPGGSAVPTGPEVLRGAVSVSPG